MLHPTYRISSETTAGLVEAGVSPLDVESLALRSVEEDSAELGDVTSLATVPADQRGVLTFVAKHKGVVAGLFAAAAVFDVVCGDDIDIHFCVSDGDQVDPGCDVLIVRSRTHLLLRAERPALNLLCHLSGIATVTRAWVVAVTDTGAQIRDTRKTTPGLRHLEKFAVRQGGGVNHRMSLSDAALVKDNHVAAAGGVSQAFEAVRRRYPDLPVEVEVDDLDQFDEALRAGADVILLDNFSVEDTREAVSRSRGRAQLEASGGLTLDRAREVASTGVDFLAVGALTHSAPVLDIGAELTVDG